MYKLSMILYGYLKKLLLYVITITAYSGDTTFGEFHGNPNILIIHILYICNFVFFQISFDGSLKDGSSTRSLAYAEVYVSPPAYSEKPSSENQTLDSKEWSECSKSVELIVL
uniref:Uncharacterized protein n=1 Tax=Cuerna arida TaxID=1464854 RepID=A0A1B6GZ45_9HEMI